MRKREIDFLHSHVAPVMRAQAQIDPAAVIFELDVTRLSVTRMNRDDKRFSVLKERCIDAIKELPMTLKMVNKHEELIREALQPTFWHEASEEQLDEVVENLGPLMGQRQPDTSPLIVLDLQDTVGAKSWLEIEGRPIKKSEYQEQV